ncbi:ras and EF-hand domain-containing protein homolog [Polypterus senegalus]|uniref:ras and EF-hand domain-containing protein homolog n=1 Tax=Polypterus senegalus TaxID=55291 RepID=UPI0019628D3E|nr:ras and EF-hand domain-containing protein homolog [Polypterus senegalus]
MATLTDTCLVKPARSSITKGDSVSSLSVPWAETEHPETGQLNMLEKAREFFQICDVEDKGFITRRDMQRLHGEFPLSADELENVFDSLDADGNGFLTLEEFAFGFSEFLCGRKISVSELQEEQISDEPETLYQNRWEEKLAGGEDDEEKHFCMMMEKLGSSNLFEDQNEVKSLWGHLRKNEAHLLSNFEEFLSRVSYQIQEANEEKKEMESALKRKVATHDDEIQRLYEEMEQQIKNEKERILLQDSEKFMSRSQDLEQQLSSKELELEQIIQKQKRLERQCKDLQSMQQETKVENVKLKHTNEELGKELERTCEELILSQEQLNLLQEEAARLHEDREIELYRVTEGLQRERASLLKQLDLLREMNKHLRDERDMSYQKPKNSVKSSSQNQRAGSIIGLYVERKQSLKSEDEDDVFANSKRRNSGTLNGHNQVNKDPDNKLAKKIHLQRIISIEEDHLPQFLEAEYEVQLNEWTEEEEEVDGTNQELVAKADRATEVDSNEVIDKQSAQVSSSEAPSSPRGQPVGKETVGNEEGTLSTPDRMFKIVLVGNSSVGKTSLLRRFCDGCFYPGTSATVGIDYSVKTVTVDRSKVALQLWDTAGQERYRSITKQFFRKADGVVVIYDITSELTFTSVRQWLSSVQEGAGDNIPIMLLGNKTDNESEREVQMKLAEQLAKDSDLIFYECSAVSGHNVKESMLHLARLLKEQEDKEKEKTIQLADENAKKKSCCSRQ